MEFTRMGGCKKCGYCCGFRNGKIIEGACRHLLKNGLCGVHEKLEKYCPACGTDHKECIKYPSSPIEELKRIGCGYKFVIKKNEKRIV